MDLAAEVGTEVRLLRATQAELAAHLQERETAYRYTDLGGLARTLPGVAEVSGPVLVAGMGRPTASRQGRRSSPTPGWRHGHRRPGTPTARANR